MVNDKDDFENNEQYYAGYLMTGINIGSYITFTPGVRYEYNKYNTTARYYNLAGKLMEGPVDMQGDFYNVKAETNNKYLFPMINLKIKPVKWFDVRLAYTQTVSRNSVGSISPRIFIDKSLKQYGVPDLKPQYNTNYDVYFSFYANKIGLFTVGAFYKKLENQVLPYSETVTDTSVYGVGSGDYGKTFTYPLNNEWPGYVKGIEIDWQTQFSYLPKPFNGIVLNANISFMQSETKYPFYQSDKIPIVPFGSPFYVYDRYYTSRASEIIGTPSMVGNVALGYELGGFSARISAYYQDYTISSTNSMEKTYNLNKDKLLRFDFQASQKIFKGFFVYLNLNNITDNPDRTIYAYYTDLLNREEKYGVSGDIGIRYKF